MGMKETFLDAEGHRTILKDGKPVNMRDMVFDIHMKDRDYAVLLLLLRALKTMMREGHAQLDMGDDGVTYFTRFDA